MKNINFILLAIVVGCSNQQATSPDKAGAEAAVEQFRLALLDPSIDILEQLTEPELTYGHSGGLIEDRETCITSMVTGKYKFLTLNFSEQNVEVIGNTAIVRHHMSADTHDRGKEAGTVSLHVLQVWNHTGEGWKLLARQAVKVPSVTP